MRLTVRTKLLGGFLLVIAMMVAVGLLAIVKLGAINRTTSELGDNAVPALQNYALLNNATQGYRKDQLRYVTAIDARDRANMIDTVAEDFSMMETGIRTGTALASSPQARRDSEPSSTTGTPTSRRPPTTEDWPTPAASGTRSC